MANHAASRLAWIVTSTAILVRLEATFTESHLAVRSGSDDDAVSLDIADLAATTFALPLVLRFNRGGTFRPLIYAGPAYVIYDITPQLESQPVPIFSGPRKKGGWIGGAGGNGGGAIGLEQEGPTRKVGP